ncbi:MAG: serine/threonine protein kinase [Sulfuricella sp.]|nr:serine/threonine protein kinase [Sulfuricella sp.]
MPSQHPSQALPEGYRLQEYLIDRPLSAGGFSVVYLGHDEAGNQFAIKEYLPSSLVARTPDFALQVQGPLTINQSAFRHGLKSFFEEGRALAKIIHPNVVRVVNFFRANETVYMVMKYEQGRSLQEYIQSHLENGGKANPIRESAIRHIFIELLNGLREVHTHKLLHLDIKPSNIYIRHDKTPLLIDFGAARCALTQEHAGLTPMYTPGFAAPEQYGGDVPLGPWTDIYAVGAAIFACMAGYAPQAANLRMEEDHQAAAKKIWHGKYSDELLDIVDWCLRLNHLERPQSVFALQKALSAPVSQPARSKGLIGGMKAAFRKVTQR